LKLRKLMSSGFACSLKLHYAGSGFSVKPSVDTVAKNKYFEIQKIIRNIAIHYGFNEN